MARRTGETITQAVITALRDRLAREERKEQAVETLVEGHGNRTTLRVLPLLDARPPDEIIGYDQHGVPR